MSLVWTATIRRSKTQCISSDERYFEIALAPRAKSWALCGQLISFFSNLINVPSCLIKILEHAQILLTRELIWLVQ
jgi:hypothetical protein